MTRATIKGGRMMRDAMKAAQPQVEAAVRKAVKDMGKPSRVKASQQQLVDCIRAYQRANTRTDMAKADALAERLVGKP